MVQAEAKHIINNINQVIVGKEDVIENVLIALLAEGHILLEDVPGTGKTILARSLAQSLAVDFKRVQFTPDLLPTDLTGMHLYQANTGEFVFREGPLFTQLLLADEINRATPRTQSALLECMEEKQISINGESKKLSRPFFVIATQNPIEQQGTFPLPEAQLDRFMMRLSMGYPDVEEAVVLLQRFIHLNPLTELKAVANADTMNAIIEQCKQVTASTEVLRYIVDIVEQTRQDVRIITGVSPRGSQSLLRAAQAKAMLNGRNFVTPHDIKQLVVPVCAHRIVLKGVHRSKQVAEQIMLELLHRVAVPTELELMGQ